jgi:aspartate carbamoyltransferase regulatory subunit
MNIPNRAPADELADVRAQLKTLGERESALKALMLNDPSARTGNRYIVEIKTVTQDRTDIKELRACYPDIVAEQTHPVEVTRVELRELSEAGEILRIKRGQTS